MEVKVEMEVVVEGELVEGKHLPHDMLTFTTCLGNRCRSSYSDREVLIATQKFLAASQKFL